MHRLSDRLPIRPVLRQPRPPLRLQRPDDPLPQSRPLRRRRLQLHADPHHADHHPDHRRYPQDHLPHGHQRARLLLHPPRRHRPWHATPHRRQPLQPHRLLHQRQHLRHQQLLPEIRHPRDDRHPT
uniref:Uncharacterized protein n=1 Tax=Arcella intermedia TaxID=1963864 RepID=A0A6B2LN23_9EUKA